MSIEPDLDEDEDEPCLPVSEMLWYLHRAAGIGTFIAILAAIIGCIVGLNLDALLEGL